MSAPFLWIILPFLVGAFLLLVENESLTARIGGGISIILALLALLIPIDTALLLGTISIKISPAIQFFGRSFELNTADGALLTVIYTLSALWFFGSEISYTTNRFVPLGLMIISLLTASIAVEPFLYAALLLEVATMLVIPLLVPPYQKAGRGVVRFLTYQTFAMPFILFSGWLLAGVEASPNDVGTTILSGTMLSLGFAFLFAVFPLYSWIPMLMEEASPYATGFLLWVLPTFTTIFALDFLDRYTWLRNSPQFTNALQFAGMLMIASGGILAALQRHLGRIFAYAVIVETGLLLLILGLQTPAIVKLTFITLIPRGLELVIWALALAILKRKAYTLQFKEVQGLARSYPMVTAALIIAHLTVSGFPLLASFPARLALWQILATQSLIGAVWVAVGMLGLLFAVIRTLAVLVMSENESNWKLNESWVSVNMLAVGIGALFILGMFPQVLNPILENLPALFERLGQ
jgi:NADH-quinone oxidoreductase subunit N